MNAAAQSELIRREARVAGLSSEPSLAAVEGRRLQLWSLTSLVLLAVAAAVVLSFGDALPRLLRIPPGIVRAGSVGLGLAFFAYTVEKEIHLRRLTALLVDEQLRNVILQSEVDRLLEVDRVRASILSAVSHDLKTPLVSILDSARLLRRELNPGQRDALADTIERHGRHLDSMLDELLSASAFEREGPPLESQTVNLPKMVRAVAAEMEARGRQTIVEAPALENVRAGLDGLRRVITNLIDNAHAHGRPPVRVVVRREGSEVIVSVLDSGDGIPEDQRRRVFELFTKLDPERPRPGIGLGLAVVPGLVASWGGRVWVADAPEGGAAFHVALPRLEPSGSRASS
ncbi:MAG: HAMP domain-containing histidine kinase [Actinobacteria bacterium]|nr:HAMP domain-containing histidine kinase [Actinomycetota bacterium]